MRLTARQNRDRGLAVYETRRGYTHTKELGIQGMGDRGG